jgi:hypothetical protein
MKTTLETSEMKTTLDDRITIIRSKVFIKISASSDVFRICTIIYETTFLTKFKITSPGQAKTTLETSD